MPLTPLQKFDLGRMTTAQPGGEEEIFAQFQNQEGVNVGPPLSLPASTTQSQLDALINQLLDNDEILPYSFFANDTEIITSIAADVLEGKKVSRESAMTIKFSPQAIFRVHPVSRCSSTLSGHEDAVLAVAFSPDGKRLATGSGDKTVRFWDLTTETPKTVGSVHRGWVLSLAWSPDGKYLASGSMDNTVQIWDGATGQALGKPLVGHTKWITGLVWEPAHLAYPSVRLASSSKDGMVKVWDVARRTCQFTFSSHTDAVAALRWSGDGTIISGSRDRTIRVWCSREGRLLQTLSGHAHWINTLALSTDYALRTGPFNQEGVIEGGGDPQEAALRRYKEAIAASGPERLVSGSDDYTMYLWCLSQNATKPVARLTGHQQVVNMAAFSPDGRHLASASFDKSVKLWNGLTGAFVASFRGHVGAVYQVAWSADSRLLLSGSKDSTVKCWELRTRKLKLDLPGHADEVYAIDWSPTGDRAASGGKDKTLKLWRQ